MTISLGLVMLAAVTELLSFRWFGEAAKGQASAGSIRDMLHFGFFLVAGFVPFTAFALKTRRNIFIAGDRVDLTNW